MRQTLALTPFQKKALLEKEKIRVSKKYTEIRKRKAIEGQIDQIGVEIENSKNILKQD